MNKKLGLAAFAVSLGVACTPAAAAYTRIFAFGDSLSDAGNVFFGIGGHDSARALCRWAFQQWPDLGGRPVANVGPWPDEALSHV